VDGNPAAAVIGELAGNALYVQALRAQTGQEPEEAA
jgi:hypothetical protein